MQTSQSTNSCEVPNISGENFVLLYFALVDSWRRTLLLTSIQLAFNYEFMMYINILGFGSFREPINQTNGSS